MQNYTLQILNRLKTDRSLNYSLISHPLYSDRKESRQLLSRIINKMHLTNVQILMLLAIGAQAASPASATPKSLEPRGCFGGSSECSLPRPSLFRQSKKGEAQGLEHAAGQNTGQTQTNGNARPPSRGNGIPSANAPLAERKKFCLVSAEVPHHNILPAWNSSF